jgi:splicing factor 3B subunit 2
MAGVKAKESKNQRRRALKKARKQEVGVGASIQAVTYEVQDTTQPATTEQADATAASAPEDTPVSNSSVLAIEIADDDALFEQFKGVIEKFYERGQDEDAQAEEVAKPEIYDNEDAIPDEEAEEEARRKSRKQRKLESRLSIAELKALVRRPDLVEWTDISAPDPTLLLAVRSHRNVVPVPTHWSLKREYLSSKRGIEKAQFSLPKFIADTGIGEMRDAALEKDAEKSLKQKQRERVQPKMGRLDVDYNKLYEAFFKFQTKPELTRFGEVYYEGKEYETNLKHLRPGELSDDLKSALNIPPGAPPPWLINQQRFGPPPSYPALKIAGLNAPLPPGADWGYHPGGYGKPPVDEFNRPLYGGDLIGVLQNQQNQQMGEPVEKSLWGELQEQEEEEEESEEEDSEEDEEEEGNEEESKAGQQTPSGLNSTVPQEFGGIESVGADFSLRKAKRGTETEEAPRAAYQVLKEQAVSSTGFFGSDRVYDLKGVRGGPTLDQADA